MVINDTRKLCGIRYKDVKAVEGGKGQKKVGLMKLERVLYLTIITILVGMLLSPSIEGSAFEGGSWGVMEAGIMSYGVEDAFRVWKRVWKELTDKAKFYIDEKFRRFVSILDFKGLKNILLTDGMTAEKARNTRYTKQDIKGVKDIKDVVKSDRTASVSKARSLSEVGKVENKVENKGNYYNVKTGDSLSKIAKKLKVSVIDLALLNNLGNDTKLKKGLVLKIPRYLYL